MIPPRVIPVSLRCQFPGRIIVLLILALTIPGAFVSNASAAPRRAAGEELFNDGRIRTFKITAVYLSNLIAKLGFSRKGRKLPMPLRCMPTSRKTFVPSATVART